MYPLSEATESSFRGIFSLRLHYPLWVHAYRPFLCQHLSVCLSVCLHVYLPVHLSVCLSACLYISIYVPFYLPVYITGSLWRRQSQQSFNTLNPFHLLFYSLQVSAPTAILKWDIQLVIISVFKDYFNTTDFLSTCPSINLSVCLSMYLPFYLPVYLPTNLSI
jgi:hypothetical protein